MVAPALAALVVVIRPEWAPAWWPQVAATRAFVSTVIALVAVLGFIVTLAFLTGRSPSWPPADVGAPVAVFVAVQVFGTLCEELGWRGVVQRVGEQFARPVVVSAMAGFLFGATHLGYWSLGVMPLLTFAITAMLMSLTITTIFTGSLWQRMLPAVVVHLGMNLGMGAIADQGEPLATTPWALGAAIVMLGIAVIGRTATNRLRTRTRL
jgi:membrane protease YdiL (CAAX protease family)